jgi:hypothetical protein
MSQEVQLFSAIRGHTFAKDFRFLCGSDFASGGTEEHVIPRWVQERFDLWDQKLTLLDGTEIPYRLLFHPPDKVVSVLMWPGGDLRNLTFDAFPWPPGTSA